MEADMERNAVSVFGLKFPLELLLRTNLVVE